jgi:hypothetical protein
MCTCVRVCVCACPLVLAKICTPQRNVSRQRKAKVTKLVEEAEGYEPNLKKKLSRASGRRPPFTIGIPLRIE